MKLGSICTAGTPLFDSYLLSNTPEKKEWLMKEESQRGYCLVGLINVRIYFSKINLPNSLSDVRVQRRSS